MSASQVFEARDWGTYGDHVGGDIADATSPALRRLVEDVVDADTGVLSGERVEVLLEEDVLGRDVGKDEVDLGLVSGSAASDDGPDDLEHGGDSSATGDHTEVTDHVGSVDEGALGATDPDGLADDERGHVLRDVALGVRLDQKVEVAGLVVTRDGGVRADNLLGRTIGLDTGGADRDVLADGEAEDVLGARELEAVAIVELSARGRISWCKAIEPSIALAAKNLHGDIVRDDGLLLELELLEDIRLEDLLHLCDWLADDIDKLHPRAGKVRKSLGDREKLTEGEEVVGAKCDGEEGGIGRPLLLDDEGSDDE